MAIKPWADFYPDILPDVIGCPIPTVDHHLKRAAQKFCAGTHVWKVWLADVTTLADTTVYTIPLPTESELMRMERATLDGRDIIITTEASLPSDWQTYPAGISDCIFTTDRKNLTLITVKAAGLILKLQVVVKPSDAAAGIEDYLFDQYAQDIARGAMASLMQQADKPYTNVQKGLLLESRFDNRIASIGFQAERGFSSAMPRGRARTF
jgi:hypothetical protein